MRLACVAVGLLGFALLIGCDRPRPAPDGASSSEPRYVENWSRLKLGMSKKNVRALLGKPAYINRYNEDTAHVPRAREFGDMDAALKADIEAIFGEPHVWQYGKFDVIEPGESAFLVYFDAGGHVTRWRQPLKGPYANATRPADPVHDEDEKLEKLTPEDLWKTPALQR